MEKLTEFADYLIKLPIAFLFSIVSVLGLILFLPEEHAKTLAVNNFRSEYRIFLGPAFLITFAFFAANTFNLVMQEYREREALRKQNETLHNLTPEEKGYLFRYVEEQNNTIYVGLDDGVMAGLSARDITYRAANVGDRLNGYAFNLQPWARKHLEKNPHILDGHSGGQ